MNLHTPTIDLKGVGPKTVKLYEKLGLFEAEDFLYYFPRDYMHYDEPVQLTEETVEKIVFFKARVVKHPLLKRAGRMQIITAVQSNNGTEVRAVWFHMPYLTKSLKAGEEYVFRARIARSGMVNDHDDHSPATLDASVILPEIPMKRNGTPEEFGALAAYLASEESAFITGQIFHLDGGLTIGK